MTTQNRLEIIVDTSKAKKPSDDLVKSLKDVETQGDKTSKKADDVGNSLEKTGNKTKKTAKETKELGKEVEKTAKGMGDYSSKTKSAGDVIKKTGDEVKTASSRFSELKKSLSTAVDDGKFGSFVQKAKGGFGSISGGAIAAGVAIGGAFVGGVGLASASLATMTIEIARNNSELAQFAMVANTSVEKFQGLAGAAATLGAAFNAEKISDQLKDFNEKIGEFSLEGTGGAAFFFEQIAVKTEKGAEGAKKLADEMSRMDGIDALQTYVDKLEDVGANQKEISAALEMVGSDLTALAPILVNGGQLWKDYQQALVDAGIITGQDAIEKSQELAAQTQSLQMQYDALKSNLASELMPVLSTLLSYFMNGSSEGGRFGGVISSIGVIAKTVAVAIVGLGTGIRNIVSIMSIVVKQMRTIGETAVNFAAADGLKAKGLALLNGAKDFAYGNAVKVGKEVYSNTVAGVKATSNIINSQSGQFDALTQAILNNKKAQLEWNKTQGKGMGGGASLNKALNPTAKPAKAPNAKSDHSAARSRTYETRSGTSARGVGAST